ncbi:Beta-lactamase superfamily domain-containing protein [Halogranum gelatinilyticum]|uniref:Beta-lactamase superfamily domain-containing protein n=1 Tax=Halogranum gelatinilyticum TaxID=660521 RepID=A0A1G9TXN6_9EURY|nr:MBL fold metallo-hydrolase [Halogranum gelatinilyticum]SDM52519.1 Beta-lactamase superfamily domain-containing protein [Halogranum gelatinilyticum]
MASLRLVRHATLLVEFDETTVLVDPMFGDVGVDPPVQNTPNDRRNPLIPLPEFDPMEGVDAVLVTHRHNDHFDDAAREALADDVPLFCQPEEADAFREEGFTDVRPVETSLVVGDVSVTRTPARHGHGELAEAMAPVAGFVFESGDETVYVAGDTVWYEEVPATIDRFEPDLVVVNAGAARFVEGEPITMDEAGVQATVDHADCPVVAVHMGAINHCLLTREELRETVPDAVVPEDGERVDLPR